MRAESLLLFPRGQSRLFVAACLVAALVLVLSLLVLAGIGVEIGASPQGDGVFMGPFRWGSDGPTA